MHQVNLYNLYKKYIAGVGLCGLTKQSFFIYFFLIRDRGRNLTNSKSKAKIKRRGGGAFAL
jgi:hypothetical protein